MVFQGERCHASGNPGIVVVDRLVYRAGIGGVEMRHIRVGPDFPMGIKIVTHFGIAAELFEAHVFAMSVGPVVGCGDNAAELAFADPVGGLRVHRPVSPDSGIHAGAHAVFLHLPGHDIDDSAHRVGAVKHRGRAAQHFYPFGHHALVGIGDRMPEKSHVLGMPVNQDQHLRGRAAPDTPQADAAGRPIGNPVAVHAP